MLEFKDALNRVLARVSRLDNETVGLADLTCRVLAPFFQREPTQ